MAKGKPDHARAEPFAMSVCLSYLSPGLKFFAFPLTLNKGVRTKPIHIFFPLFSVNDYGISPPQMKTLEKIRDVF